MSAQRLCVPRINVVPEDMSKAGTYLKQSCFLIGSYNCPILTIFYGPVNITKYGSGDVGVPESIYVGFGNVDEQALGRIGVGPSEGETLTRTD